jgi:hypothetical protein
LEGLRFKISGLLNKPRVVVLIHYKYFLQKYYLIGMPRHRIIGMNLVHHVALFTASDSLGTNHPDDLSHLKLESSLIQGHQDADELDL